MTITLSIFGKCVCVKFDEGFQWGSPSNHKVPPIVYPWFHNHVSHVFDIIVNDRLGKYGHWGFLLNNISECARNSTCIANFLMAGKGASTATATGTSNFSLRANCLVIPFAAFSPSPSSDVAIMSQRLIMLVSLANRPWQRYHQWNNRDQNQGSEVVLRWRHRCGSPEWRCLGTDPLELIRAISSQSLAFHHGRRIYAAAQHNRNKKLYVWEGPGFFQLHAATLLVLMCALVHNQHSPCPNLIQPHWCGQKTAILWANL